MTDVENLETAIDHLRAVRDRDVTRDHFTALSIIREVFMKPLNDLGFIHAMTTKELSSFQRELLRRAR